MPDAPAIPERRREGKEQQVAAGHKGVRQTVLPEPDRAVACQRRVADPPEHAKIDQVILAEPALPFGELAAQPLRDSATAFQLNPVPLAVIEPDRLDPREAAQRPGETGRR